MIISVTQIALLSLKYERIDKSVMVCGHAIHVAGYCQALKYTQHGAHETLYNSTAT
jgi:hypothetical protein